jgi:hypothetical protein
VEDVEAVCGAGRGGRIVDYIMPVDQVSTSGGEVAVARHYVGLG